MIREVLDLRKVVVAIFIFVCFILQCTVFHSLAMGGIIPNLMIILTSSFGFMRGEKEGLLIGFVSGLLMDIFFGEFLGLNALFFMYIGYLNGKFSMIFYPEDIKLPLALITVSDLTYGLLSYTVLFLLRGRLQFSHYLIHCIIPEMIYTVVLTMFLYPIIIKCNTWLETREKRSAQKFV